MSDEMQPQNCLCDRPIPWHSAAVANAAFPYQCACGRKWSWDLSNNTLIADTDLVRALAKEQLQCSAIVCSKEGCMLWKEHKIPHMTASEIESLYAEVLDRREIMRTLHGGSDITLEEAKALSHTQATTLRLIRERGL